MSNDPLVPLSVLALDLGNTTPSQLAARLSDRVLLDDLGRLAIDRAIAAQLIAEHQAAARAQREREQRRAAERKTQLAELDHATRGAAVYPPCPATPSPT